MHLFRFWGVPDSLVALALISDKVGIVGLLYSHHAYLDDHHALRWLPAVSALACWVVIRQPVVGVDEHLASHDVLIMAYTAHTAWMYMAFIEDVAPYVLLCTLAAAAHVACLPGVMHGGIAVGLATWYSVSDAVREQRHALVDN